MAGPRGAEGVPKKCQKPSRRIHATQASTPTITKSTMMSPSPPVRMSSGVTLIISPPAPRVTLHEIEGQEPGLRAAVTAELASHNCALNPPR